MSGATQVVDLTQVPRVPWAWVDERVYAAIRGCSVKVLQRERRLNIGCPFRRINGTSIRYKLGDITAFLESMLPVSAVVWANSTAAVLTSIKKSKRMARKSEP